MEKKNAYLISCSDHFNHRLNVIDAYLRSKGYEVTYITSDFDHATKQKFDCTVPDSVQIHASPYHKNLSLGRICSHQKFARDVFRYIEGQKVQPAVVVALVPPNFLVHYAAKYKKKHPEVRLIFDIFDMWPEAFPSAGMKKMLLPIFKVWEGIRDKGLLSADFVTTECALFQSKLGLDPDKSAVIYLAADSLSCGLYPAGLGDDSVSLCYLGSINNIIDIPRICDLLRQIAAVKPVTLHIIGAGERQQELISAAQTAGAKVEHHGAVFDDSIKQEIMSKCHFGLNIVKPTVCLGLTMKSVGYFQHGLPIISNVPADTQSLIEKWKTGIQLDENTAQIILNMSVKENLQMRSRVTDMFQSCFDRAVINDQYSKLLKDLL